MNHTKVVFSAALEAYSAWLISHYGPVPESPEILLSPQDATEIGMCWIEAKSGERDELDARFKAQLIKKFGEPRGFKVYQQMVSKIITERIQQQEEIVHVEDVAPPRAGVPGLQNQRGSIASPLVVERVTKQPLPPSLSPLTSFTSKLAKQYEDGRDQAQNHPQQQQERNETPPMDLTAECSNAGVSSLARAAAVPAARTTLVQIQPLSIVQSAPKFSEAHVIPPNMCQRKQAEKEREREQKEADKPRTEAMHPLNHAMQMSSVIGGALPVRRTDRSVQCSPESLTLSVTPTTYIPSISEPPSVTPLPPLLGPLTEVLHPFVPVLAPVPVSIHAVPVGGKRKADEAELEGTPHGQHIIDLTHDTQSTQVITLDMPHADRSAQRAKDIAGIRGTLRDRDLLAVLDKNDVKRLKDKLVELLLDKV